MKLTKKILNEHGIHNSWDIAKKLNSPIFVTYEPAINTGLNARYAYWKYTRFTENGTSSKSFIVTSRKNKLLVFRLVITFTKERYGIDITDKDPFGAYHPKDTLEKLEALIKAESKE